MIIDKKQGGPFTIKLIYFAPKPSLAYGWLSTFISAKSNAGFLFFKREEFNTLITDLRMSEDELLNSFQRKTIYEIKRSMSDDSVRFDFRGGMDDFISLYNDFAHHRAWAAYKTRVDVQDNVCVTVCKFNDNVMIAHQYLLDKQAKRVCLQSSVSRIDSIQDLAERALLGRSNRHLHYADMLYFKSLGFEQYDFGGYDNYNIYDKKKSGINKFKDSFNGTLVFESTYTSYPLAILLTLKKMLRLKKSHS